MRLTDWLRMLRRRFAWPPEAVPVPFPILTTSNRRPHLDGRIPDGFSRHNAPCRLLIPTRRLAAGIRREPPPRPVS